MEDTNQGVANPISETADDPGPRLARWRLIERLVELSALPEDQIAYIARSGSDRMGQRVWELAAGFWEWTDGVLDHLVATGAVLNEVARQVWAVVDAARIIRVDAGREWEESQSIWLHTSAALASDRRWAEVRRLATEALAGFESMGLPIPNLMDRDFNVAREDAP